MSNERSAQAACKHQTTVSWPRDTPTRTACVVCGRVWFGDPHYGDAVPAVVLRRTDARTANVAVTMMETARGVSGDEQQHWRETRERIEEAIRGS